jgi:hypothetical protein
MLAFMTTLLNGGIGNLASYLAAHVLLCLLTRRDRTFGGGAGAHCARECRALVQA